METSTKNSTSWIRLLAEQSWEAELIISGVAFLPTSLCQISRNKLKITKEYYTDEGEQRIILIPFLFEPDPLTLQQHPTSKSEALPQPVPELNDDLP